MLLKSVMPRFITYIILEELRKYLSRDSLLTLIHAFITSRLDYCNGLLYGLPNSQIVKLQRVQNAAARLVLSLSKYSHISPALYQLHWLPGPGCIKPALKWSLKYVTYESVMGTLTGVA